MQKCEVQFGLYLSSVEVCLPGHAVQLPHLHVVVRMHVYIMCVCTYIFCILVCVRVYLCVCVYFFRYHGLVK